MVVVVVVVAMVDPAESRGGCTAPAGLPAAGAPRSPTLALRPASPPLPQCPALPDPRGLYRPSQPLSWALPRLLAPGPGGPPPLCPLARVLPASLPVSLAVFLSADRALARPVRPAPAGLNALLLSLRPSLGAAARARILPVPLPFPCAVSCVPPSAARARACPVCLSSPAAAHLGALPVPLPSLLTACALACPLCLSLGAPPVASRPSFGAPVAGTLPRPCAVPPLLDLAPGVRAAAAAAAA